jgi:putative hemolysin
MFGAPRLEDPVINQLITLRAPGLRHPLIWPLVRFFVLPLVGYDQAVAMLTALKGLRGPEMLEYLTRYLDLDLIIKTPPTSIPQTGAAILVANHPTGAADGIAIYQAIRDIRRDVVFFALDGTIAAAEGSRDFLIPVETSPDKATLESGKETAAAADAAFRSGKLVIIYPAGRLPKHVDGRPIEHPWVMTPVKYGWRYQCPIIPVHIDAKNSRLHHFMRNSHASLRDITVFNEITNKRGKPFALTFGEALTADQLPESPGAATRLLRAFTTEGLPFGVSWDHFRRDDADGTHEDRPDQRNSL